MSDTIFKFGLGAVVIDGVTTLRGVIVGRCEYLNGCVQYDVQPQGLFEGKILPSLWVDEEQLALAMEHYADLAESDPLPCFVGEGV